MTKTKLAVIQDDILAAKHALANNLPFEGLEGEQLNSVLQTLLAQRAEAAATIATTGSSLSSGRGGGGGGSAISRMPVNGARPKAVAAKKGKKKTPAAGTRVPKVEAASPASSKKTPQSKKKTPLSKRKTPPKKTTPQPKTASRSSTAKKTPAPEQRRQASSGKAAKKPRTSGPLDRLRQLRKSIKIGDTLSVVMDVNIGGCWEKEWVEGEVVREVRRGQTDTYIARRVNSIRNIV